MYRVSQESRELASKLLSLLRGNGYGGAAFVLLTRRPYDSVKGIMFEILRKWDFENDEPLPKGVGRQYDEGRSWLFQQRTGESFDTPPRRTSRIGTSTSSMLQFITSNPN
ncbi:hypothetical protein CPB86DRAFT_79720 [Serendipita vermifera]|nr:hypothetical protein CPB86DRAFT_79720 [Serendipita vermifera]